MKGLLGLLSETERLACFNGDDVRSLRQVWAIHVDWVAPSPLMSASESLRNVFCSGTE
jgi:hypothetical protein